MEWFILVMGLLLGLLVVEGLRVLIGGNLVLPSRRDKPKRSRPMGRYVKRKGK